MENLIERMNQRLTLASVSQSYIPTGLRDLDELIHGLRKTDLIVISSNPGDGKTTFALTILYNIIQNKNLDIMFLTKENYVSDKLFRVITGRSMDSAGDFDEEFYNQFNEKIANLGHLYWDSSYNSYEELYKVIENNYYDYRPRAIIIDDLSSLNLLDKRNLKVGESELHYIVHQLKKLAERFDLPIIVMANDYTGLSDSIWGRSMDMHDQGACMEFSDVFIKLSRPEAHHVYEDPQGNSLRNIEVVEVKKNKNGKCGEFYMHFDKETGLISEFPGKVIADSDLPF